MWSKAQSEEIKSKQQFHTILIVSLFLKTKADETTINQKSNHYAQQSVQIS